MPEYLSPGVYVAEVALNARPIEGVSTSTSSLVRHEVIGRLKGLVDQISPDWTEHNDNDPGIALMELLAWLTEISIYRLTKIPEPSTVAFVQQLPERGKVAAARLAAAALALVADRPQSHSSVLKHVRFFDGQRYEDLAEVRGATIEKETIMATNPRAASPPPSPWKKKRKSKKRRKTQPSTPSPRKKLRR